MKKFFVNLQVAVDDDDATLVSVSGLVGQLLIDNNIQIENISSQEIHDQ